MVYTDFFKVTLPDGRNGWLSNDLIYTGKEHQARINKINSICIPKTGWGYAGTLMMMVFFILVYFKRRLILKNYIFTSDYFR